MKSRPKAGPHGKRAVLHSSGRGRSSSRAPIASPVLGFLPFLVLRLRLILLFFLLVFLLIFLVLIVLVLLIVLAYVLAIALVLVLGLVLARVPVLVLALSTKY